VVINDAFLLIDPAFAVNDDAFAFADLDRTVIDLLAPSSIASLRPAGQQSWPNDDGLAPIDRAKS
jgi:hypothetical protein